MTPGDSQGKARYALLMAGKHGFLLSRDASSMTMCCSSTGCTVSSGLFGVRRRPFQAPAVNAARPPLSFLVGLPAHSLHGRILCPGCRCTFGSQVLKNQVLRQLDNHMVSCGNSARLGAPSLLLLYIPVICLPRCGLTQGRMSLVDLCVSERHTHAHTVTVTVTVTWTPCHSQRERKTSATAKATRCQRTEQSS